MRGDLEYLEAKLAEADDEIRRLEERLRGVGANRYWEGRWRDANAEIERMKRKQGTFCNQCGRDIDPTTEYLTEIIAGRFICDDCVLKQPETKVTRQKKTSNRENPLPVVCTGTCVADKDHADITIGWVGAGYGRFRLTFNQLQHLMFRLQKVHQEMNHMHFVARQNAPPAGEPETEPALTP